MEAVVAAAAEEGEVAVSSLASIARPVKTNESQEGAALRRAHEHSNGILLLRQIPWDIPLIRSDGRWEPWWDVPGPVQRVAGFP